MQTNNPSYVLNPQSLAKGSKINTINGLKQIEDIRKDDIIKGYDIFTETLVNSKVVNVVYCGSAKVIAIDGLLVTKNHLIFANNHWTKAKNVKVGDKVLRLKDRKVYKATVKDIVFIGYRKVYDLTSEPSHNMFANGILVHNYNSTQFNETTFNGQPTASANALFFGTNF